MSDGIRSLHGRLDDLERLVGRRLEAEGKREAEWLHEYADTNRPITAAFAGAPSNSFTVYGATPARDSAIIGFTAGTQVADAAQIYLRYDGEIAPGSSNHTLNVGLRFSW